MVQVPASEQSAVGPKVPSLGCVDESERTVSLLRVNFLAGWIWVLMVVFIVVSPFGEKWLFGLPAALVDVVCHPTGVLLVPMTIIPVATGRYIGNNPQHRWFVLTQLTRNFYLSLGESFVTTAGIELTYGSLGYRRRPLSNHWCLCSQR